MVRRMALIMVLAAGLATLATGCASFWDDQGTASRTSAEARLRQAEAARQNAQAAIIDAEARGAMAASQADALRTSVDAVVDLADDGEYVVLFAGIAMAVLAFAGWAIWTAHRRPAAPPAATPVLREIVVALPDGRTMRLVQEPGESWPEFAEQVAVLQAKTQNGAALLSAPEVRR